MKHLHSIDGLRAIAILSVLLVHAGEISPHHILQIWTHWGARGVDLFFVISGFCLSFTYLQARARGDMTPFDRRAFAYGRVYRLLPAYYGALLLFWILSATPFGWPAVVWGHFSAPTLAQYLGYFAMLYEDPIGIHGPHANGAYWTLALELRWYVLFPFLLALYLRSRAAFAAVAVLAYLDYWYGLTLIDAGTLPCFMAGIVAADLYAHGKLEAKALRLWLPAATIIAFAAAAIVQTHSAIDHGEARWYLISFMLVCAGLGSLRPLLSLPPLVFIGRASYSIYLVHFPFMMALQNNGGTFFPVLCIGLGTGIAFYLLVEKPAQKMRATWKKSHARARA